MHQFNRSAFEIAESRWCLSIIAVLLDGPMRFTDLRKSLLQLSANILTQKLRELEKCGVVRRRVLNSTIAVSIYELTPWGYEARCLLLELQRWANSETRKS